MMANATWQLDGSLAQVCRGPLTATIDVTAPQHGLRDLSIHGARTAGALLGVSVDSDAEPADVYERGDDLVVAYRETPARPFSVQVYWSAAPLSDAAGVILDAVVSIQTRQWEAYPRVTVASSLDGAERVDVAAGVALLRVSGADWSYAELALPEDFAGPAGAPGDAASPSATRWTFGDQFMERGVIRRLRVRGAILPRAGDEVAAARLVAALRAEQPPLTA